MRQEFGGVRSSRGDLREHLDILQKTYSETQQQHEEVRRMCSDIKTMKNSSFQSLFQSSTKSLYQLPPQVFSRLGLFSPPSMRKSSQKCVPVAIDSDAPKPHPFETSNYRSRSSKTLLFYQPQSSHTPLQQSKLAAEPLLTPSSPSMVCSPGENGDKEDEEEFEWSSKAPLATAAETANDPPKQDEEAVIETHEVPPSPSFVAPLPPPPPQHQQESIHIEAIMPSKEDDDSPVPLQGSPDRLSSGPIVPRCLAFDDTVNSSSYIDEIQVQSVAPLPAAAGVATRRMDEASSTSLPPSPHTENRTATSSSSSFIAISSTSSGRNDVEIDEREEEEEEVLEHPGTKDEQKSCPKSAALALGRLKQRTGERQTVKLAAWSRLKVLTAQKQRSRLNTTLPSSRRNQAQNSDYSGHDETVPRNRHHHETHLENKDVNNTTWRENDKISSFGARGNQQAPAHRVNDNNAEKLPFPQRQQHQQQLVVGAAQLSPASEKKKTYLKRRSQAMPMHPPPDWSSVQPKTRSKLDSNLILKTKTVQTPRQDDCRRGNSQHIKAAATAPPVDNVQRRVAACTHNSRVLNPPPSTTRTKTAAGLSPPPHSSAAKRRPWGSCQPSPPPSIAEAAHKHRAAVAPPPLHHNSSMMMNMHAPLGRNRPNAVQSQQQHYSMMPMMEPPRALSLPFPGASSSACGPLGAAAGLSRFHHQQQSSHSFGNVNSGSNKGSTLQGMSEMIHHSVSHSSGGTANESAAGPLQQYHLPGSRGGGWAVHPPPSQHESGTTTAERLVYESSSTRNSSSNMNKKVVLVGRSIEDPLGPLLSQVEQLLTSMERVRQR